jgi:hypothetical protein
MQKGKPTCGVNLYLLMERYDCTLADYILEHIHPTNTKGAREVEVDMILAVIVQVRGATAGR